MSRKRRDVFKGRDGKVDEGADNGEQKRWVVCERWVIEVVEVVQVVEWCKV